MTTMKLSRNWLTIDGKRCGIWVCPGPWNGAPDKLIKLRPKRRSFPREFRTALEIENNTDIQVDYFEADCIRLMPGHPLYAAARATIAKATQP